MKKRIFPICLSFLISAAFLAVGIYFTYCFVKHLARNFAILAYPQAFMPLSARFCARISLTEQEPYTYSQSLLLQH